MMEEPAAQVAFHDYPSNSRKISRCDPAPTAERTFPTLSRLLQQVDERCQLLL